MYYQDLSFYQNRISKPIENILNVGWLDIDEKFPVGNVSPDFLKKLKTAIAGSELIDLHFNRVRGVHSCNFCKEREVVVLVDGVEVLLGMSEILVPDEKNNGFYASPSLVLHYIEQHNYLPPLSFINSVLKLDITKKYSAEEIFDELSSL